MRQYLKIPPALGHEHHTEAFVEPEPRNQRTAQSLTRDSMLTLIVTTRHRTSILKAELPRISLGKILTCQSERFTSAGLSVSIYNFPTSGHATHQENCSFLIYRPQDQKGTNLWTALPPGLAPKPVSGNHCLIVPPEVSIRVEWINAAGRLAKFGFSPGFFTGFFFRVL